MDYLVWQPLVFKKKENILKPQNEISDLSDNEEITKEIVDTMVEKIVVSRYGSIEIMIKGEGV